MCWSRCTSIDVETNFDQFGRHFGHFSWTDALSSFANHITVIFEQLWTSCCSFGWMAFQNAWLALWHASGPWQLARCLGTFGNWRSGSRSSQCKTSSSSPTRLCSADLLRNGWSAGGRSCWVFSSWSTMCAGQSFTTPRPACGTICETGSWTSSWCQARQRPCRPLWRPWRSNQLWIWPSTPRSRRAADILKDFESTGQRATRCGSATFAGTGPFFNKGNYKQSFRKLDLRPRLHLGCQRPRERPKAKLRPHQEHHLLAWNALCSHLWTLPRHHHHCRTPVWIHNFSSVWRSRCNDEFNKPWNRRDRITRWRWDLIAVGLFGLQTRPTIPRLGIKTKKRLLHTTTGVWIRTRRRRSWSRTWRRCRRQIRVFRSTTTWLCWYSFDFWGSAVCLHEARTTEEVAWHREGFEKNLDGGAHNLPQHDPEQPTLEASQSGSGRDLWRSCKHHRKSSGVWTACFAAHWQGPRHQFGYPWRPCLAEITYEEMVLLFDSLSPSAGFGRRWRTSTTTGDLGSFRNYVRRLSWQLKRLQTTSER